MYSIYLIKNLANSKLYVGQTSMPLHKRFNKHKSDKNGYCVKLFNAMNKYGREKFSTELLAVCGDQTTANYLETSFIEEFDTIKTGYNIRQGGSSGKASLESRRKMSLAHLGKHHSKETISKISLSQTGDKNHRYGKKASFDHKKKLSKARCGKRPAAKLYWESVRKIRQDYILVQNYRKLSIKYGVSLNTIKNIVIKKSWKE